MTLQHQTPKAALHVQQGFQTVQLQDALQQTARQDVPSVLQQAMC